MALIEFHVDGGSGVSYYVQVIQQVRDGDVVLVPRGYHPVAAGPGYDLYYLNVMAGPARRWLVTTDPDHRWQLD